MKVEFLPLTASLIPACRAFNERLRRDGNAPFLLPETAHLADPGSPGGILRSHHVAVDENGEVRGGVLLAEQRGWLAGRVIPLVNVQSPLSEGVIDRRFLTVSLQMLSSSPNAAHLSGERGLPSARCGESLHQFL